MRTCLAILIIVLCVSCLSSKIERDNVLLNKGLVGDVVYPKENPYSSQKEQLGRLLFWDPILSGSKSISCATCHHPNNGYAQNIPLSIMHVDDKDAISRNTPTVLNVAFNGYGETYFADPKDAQMFWDNRVRSLEAQALFPIRSNHEMRGNYYTEDVILDTIVARLQQISEYVSLFESAFGDSVITEERLSQALANFERSLVNVNSPYDQFVKGDFYALSEDAKKGLNAFIDVGCVSCHNGPMFSDFTLHNLSVPKNSIRNSVDLGDGDFRFRTPSLRNVSFTAPYMHNGVFNSLEEVVDFYDAADDRSQNEFIDDEKVDTLLQQLSFRPGQKKVIIAFLESLSDYDFDREIPKSVPSGLIPGGIVD